LKRGGKVCGVIILETQGSNGMKKLNSPVCEKGGTGGVDLDAGTRKRSPANQSLNKNLTLQTPNKKRQGRKKKVEGKRRKMKTRPGIGGGSARR